MSTETHTNGANGSHGGPDSGGPILLRIGRPPSEQPAQPYPSDVRMSLERDARTIIARYPQKRSALLPLLHLVQSVDGYVTPTGISFCADMIGLTQAETTAVATFYSMYRREPTGTYRVGVCTTTLCAVLGGDEILDALREQLGVDHGGTTEDGAITLEHLECNAACDYAPVVMVNWEFFDNQTPQSARDLMDALRSGEEVSPTRGAPLCTFRQTERILAGFPDERPGALDAGGVGGEPTLAGLRVARANGMAAPALPDATLPDVPDLPDPGLPDVPDRPDPGLPEPTVPEPTEPQPHTPTPDVPNPNVPGPDTPGPAIPDPNLPDTGSSDRPTEGG